MPVSNCNPRHSGVGTWRAPELTVNARVFPGLIRGSYLAIIVNLFTLELTYHFGNCLQKVNES